MTSRKMGNMQGSYEAEGSLASEGDGEYHQKNTGRRRGEPEYVRARMKSTGKVKDLFEVEDDDVSEEDDAVQLPGVGILRVNQLREGIELYNAQKKSKARRPIADESIRKYSSFMPTSRTNRTGVGISREGFRLSEMQESKPPGGVIEFEKPVKSERTERSRGITENDSLNASIEADRTDRMNLLQYDNQQGDISAMRQEMGQILHSVGVIGKKLTDVNIHKEFGGITEWRKKVSKSIAEIRTNVGNINGKVDLMDEKIDNMIVEMRETQLSIKSIMCSIEEMTSGHERGQKHIDLNEMNTVTETERVEPVVAKPEKLSSVIERKEPLINLELRERKESSEAALRYLNKKNGYDTVYNLRKTFMGVIEHYVAADHTDCGGVKVEDSDKGIWKYFQTNGEDKYCSVCSTICDEILCRDKVLDEVGLCGSILDKICEEDDENRRYLHYALQSVDNYRIMMMGVGITSCKGASDKYKLGTIYKVLSNPNFCVMMCNGDRLRDTGLRSFVDFMNSLDTKYLLGTGTLSMSEEECLIRTEEFLKWMDDNIIEEEEEIE